MTRTNPNAAVATTKAKIILQRKKKKKQKTYSFYNVEGTLEP